MPCLAHDSQPLTRVINRSLFGRSRLDSFRLARANLWARHWWRSSRQIANADRILFGIDFYQRLQLCRQLAAVTTTTCVAAASGRTRTANDSDRRLHTDPRARNGISPYEQRRVRWKDNWSGERFGEKGNVRREPRFFALGEFGLPGIN